MNPRPAVGTTSQVANRDASHTAVRNAPIVASDTATAMRCSAYEASKKSISRKGLRRLLRSGRLAFAMNRRYVAASSKSNQLDDSKRIRPQVPR